jgi:hypothetical protein
VLRREAQQLGHDPLVRVLLQEVDGVLQARDLSVREGAQPQLVARRTSSVNRFEWLCRA